MLESYFKRNHTLRRLRAEPTGRYMDDFAKTLHTKGYGVWAAQAYLRAAAHLGRWMMRRGFSVMKLNEDVIGKFARHLPSCHCVGKNRGIYDVSGQFVTTFLPQVDPLSCIALKLLCSVTSKTASSLPQGMHSPSAPMIAIGSPILTDVPRSKNVFLRIPLPFAFNVMTAQ
jgi:hypothetical protein